jgi:hypothetical protein
VSLHEEVESIQTSLKSTYLTPQVKCPNIDPNGTTLNADPFNDNVTVYFPPCQSGRKGFDSSKIAQSNSSDKRTYKLVSGITKIGGKMATPAAWVLHRERKPGSWAGTLPQLSRCP